jgi:hypothetical protein
MWLSLPKLNHMLGKVPLDAGSTRCNSGKSKQPFPVWKFHVLLSFIFSHAPRARSWLCPRKGSDQANHCSSPRKGLRSFLRCSLTSGSQDSFQDDSRHLLKANLAPCWVEMWRRGVGQELLCAREPFWLCSKNKSFFQHSPKSVCNLGPSDNWQSLWTSSQWVSVHHIIKPKSSWNAI